LGCSIVSTSQLLKDLDHVRGSSSTDRASPPINECYQIRADLSIRNWSPLVSRRRNMQTKAFSLAMCALLLSAGAVSAATVTDNLNVRSGPGFGYSVIGWMPAGSAIRVLSCGPSWCRVAWNGTAGYTGREFISRVSGPVYAASPAAGVVAPRYSYTYAWSPSGNWAPYVGYGGWHRYYWYR